MAGESLKIVSVIGGSRRAGRWTVPAATSVIALFGRSVIDMRLAESDAEQITITTLSAFAGLTILVPEGANVEPAGTAILASSACLVPASDATCELPPIRVEAMTVLGKLRILTVTDDEAGIERKRRWWSRRKKVAAPATSATEPEPDTAPAEPQWHDHLQLPPLDDDASPPLVAPVLEVASGEDATPMPEEAPAPETVERPEAAIAPIEVPADASMN